ncbi:MAG: hypothetical protein Q7Q71_00190 [Verrucomicrobiota bacterium JB023]|nr:hypothetical protein [Verrucomicrobiota bacterium JB023]
MKLGCFPWLITAALIIGGGQSLFTGLTNTKVTEIDIRDLDSATVEAKWLRITGGHLDVLNYSYTSFLGGTPSEVYVPLVPPDVEEGQLIHVLFKTSDSAILSTVEELQKIQEEGQPDGEGIMKLLEMSDEKLRPKRDVEGIVLFGIDTGRDERKIRESYENLAPKNIILAEGEQPSWFLGGLSLIGGVVLGGFLLRGTKTKTVAGPPTLPPN